MGLLQQKITWYKKPATLEGKLIIIPALGHQNKGKSNFTGSGVFVLKMSQCGNNNELALQHGGLFVLCDRLLQKASYSTEVRISGNYQNCLNLVIGHISYI